MFRNLRKSRLSVRNSPASDSLPSMTDPPESAASTTLGQGEPSTTPVLRLHMKSGAEVDIRSDSITVEGDTHLLGVSLSGRRIAVPVMNIDWYEGEEDEATCFG